MAAPHAAPVPIEKSADFEMDVGGSLFANMICEQTAVHAVFADCSYTSKPKKRQWGPRKVARLFGERRSSRMSEPCHLWQGEGYGVCDGEPHNPLGEPTTSLQAESESVIVGYTL